MKLNTKKWFDEKVSENIDTKDKLFKRYKNSRLQIDKELYKKAKYNTLTLITAKNEHFLMINYQDLLENSKNCGKP